MISKKKIFAIILFIFIGLFVFTFANPSSEFENLEPVGGEVNENDDNDNTVDNTNGNNQDENQSDDQNNKLDNDTQNDYQQYNDEAPVITIDPKNVTILLGDQYDVMTGVKVTDDLDNVTVSADITDTTKLTVGEHIINYVSTTDRKGNSAKETRTIIVLDPETDEDNDGFNNKEEIEGETDPNNEEDYPETVDPTIALKGSNPYVMLTTDTYMEPGVEITLDKHDTVTTIDDVVVSGNLTPTIAGDYEITYTITDRYGKSASVTREVKVLNPNTDYDNDGFTNGEEMENPVAPTDPTKPEGPNNPLVDANTTDPLNPESHPNTYAPTITLKGNNPYVMLTTETYVEAGVEITLDPHDTITTINDVVITGSVENEVGEYTLTYTITDRYGKSATVSRTVKVLEPTGDNDNDGFTNEEELTTQPTTNPEDGNSHPETRVPTITLTSPISWPKGTAWVDPGYEITLDPHDTVTSKTATITGNVDVNTLGQYTLTYEITDRYGKTAQATRIVNVKEDLNGNGEVDETETKYTVTFNAGSNGTLTGTTVYENILTGLTFEEAGIEIPTINPNEGYKTTGWDVEITEDTEVTNNVTYTAQYFEDRNNNNIDDEQDSKYTVTFSAGENGTLTGTTVYENILTGLTFSQAGIEIPVITANEGYKTAGWNVAITEETKVTASVTYTAQYIAQTGIEVVLKPNAQLEFNVDSDVNIKDYFTVSRVYENNTKETITDYTVEGFTTARIGKDIQLTIKDGNFENTDYTYDILSENAHDTKFEIKLNTIGKYNRYVPNCEVKWALVIPYVDCNYNDVKLEEIQVEGNFLELTETYNEIADIDSIVVTYNDNKTQELTTINNEYSHEFGIFDVPVDGSTKAIRWESYENGLFKVPTYRTNNLNSTNIKTVTITYTLDNETTKSIVFKYQNGEFVA